MTASSTRALITEALQDYGVEMLVILGAIIGVALGFFVFKIGWKKVKALAK